MKRTRILLCCAALTPLAHGAQGIKDLSLLGMSHLLSTASLAIDSGATLTNAGTLNGAGTFDFSAGILTLAANQVGWVSVNKSGSSLSDLANHDFGQLANKPTSASSYGIL